MKKAFLILFSLHLVIVLHAQNDSKFQIGAEGGLGWNYRFLTTSDAQAQQMVDSRNSYEIGSLLPQIGVHFDWNIRPDFKLGLGLSWSMRGYRTSTRIGSYLDSNMNRSAFETRFTYYSHWLEIPVQCQWTCLHINERSSLFAVAGIAPAFNLQSDIVSIVYEGGGKEKNKSHNDVVKDFVLFANIGVGYTKVLSGRWNMDLQLNAQFSVPNYDKERYINNTIDTPIDGYYWSIVPKIGLNYKL